MASASAITSRRSILGAFAFSPLAALAASSLPLPHQRPWDRALADYAWKMTAAEREAGRLSDTAAGAACDAEDVLMSMPAPDTRALLWKLEIWLKIEADGYTASWSGDYLAQTLTDMRRLLA